MRVGMSAILVLVAFLAVTFLQSHYSENLSPFLYERITATFEEDTASQNAIAAILLNYRMYDTVFEAMILLTSVMGMLHFLYTGDGHGRSHGKKAGKEAHKGGKND